MTAPAPPASAMPHTILWIDPGLWSGVAVWQPATRYYVAWELQFKSLGAYLGQMPGGPGTWIGWERFTITQQTVKLAQTRPNAFEVIGMCTWIAHARGWRVLPEQAPSERKAAPAAMLRRLGMHPGKQRDDDALSASSHLAVFLLNSGLMPADLAALV